MLKIIRQKIKKFLRKWSPNVYSVIYKLYLRIINSPIKKERAAKYAQFTKRGFYNFELEDIKFEIMLDPDNGGVDLEIFTDKNFESKMLKFIRQHLGKDKIFLDIGANIGQHSLYASYLCKRVYSFEPIKRLYDQFNKSIVKNNILNITTYNYALGSSKKDLPIYSNESNMAGSSVLVRDNKNFLQNVKILRLDDVYKEIGIDGVDMMKIDVEGYELEVLLGAENFIKKYSPKILMEFSPYFYKKVDISIPNRIIALLIGVGYELWDIGEDGAQKKRINKLSDLDGASQINLFCRRIA